MLQFGAVKITKNSDTDKNKYFGYGIEFDGKGVFSHPTGSFGNNARIFGVDTSSSVQIDNKKDILIPGKGPTQGLGEHSLTAEKMYLVNFSATKRRFCLSLHFNGANSLFVNGFEVIKFKAKDSEIIPNLLYLGNLSKDFSASNMKKKTGLYGTGYDFSADYGAISVDGILSIHKYLIKNTT